MSDNTIVGKTEFRKKMYEIGLSNIMGQGYYFEPWQTVGHGKKGSPSLKNGRPLPTKFEFRNMTHTLEFLTRRILTPFYNKYSDCINAKDFVNSFTITSNGGLSDRSSSTSKHNWGMAFDFRLTGMPDLMAPLRLFCWDQWGRYNQEYKFGLGFYYVNDTTRAEFIHIDTSPRSTVQYGSARPAAWDNTANSGISGGRFTDELNNRSSIEDICNENDEIVLDGPVQTPQIQSSGGQRSTPTPQNNVSSDSAENESDASESMVNVRSSDVFMSESHNEKIKIDFEDLSSFMTPEEYRKGIVPEMMTLDEWHLRALSQDMGQEEDRLFLSEEERSEDTNRNRRDLDADRLRSYMMAMIEGEYFRRRFRSRSIPASTGPFNPYPVPGFPALVMSPSRPIIAKIEGINHSINVQAASGTTSISFSHPRYWNEGDVWYNMGGKEEAYENEENEHLYKKYPPWVNSHIMATNTFKFSDPKVEATRGARNEIDNFYQFFLDCNAVEYESNNKDIVSNPGRDDKIRKSIMERDPGDFDVNQETLNILDYNRLIAETDSDGYYKENTIAGFLWGRQRPEEIEENHTDVENQIEYTERYGIKEKELFTEFLNNKYNLHDDIVILTGQTFNHGGGNGIQKQIVSYIKDIEKRKLEDV